LSGKSRRDPSKPGNGPAIRAIQHYRSVYDLHAIVRNGTAPD